MDGMGYRSILWEGADYDTTFLSLGALQPSSTLLINKRTKNENKNIWDSTASSACSRRHGKGNGKGK